MTKSVHPYLPENLTEIVAQIIAQRTEGRKIDFKRQYPLELDRKALGEFIQDLCSFANTDDPQHYGDVGYIIIGRDRNGIAYPIPEAFDEDKASASLHNQLSKYILPAIDFHVKGPIPHADGPVIVISIPPSQQQPHVPLRDLGDATAGALLVRNGDTKAPATALDLHRMLAKQAARLTAPLQEEISQLRGTVASQQAQLAELRGTLAPELASGAERIAAGLRSPATILMREVGQEIARFRSAVEQVDISGTAIPYTTLSLPHSAALVRSEDLPGLKAAVEGLEEATRPLIELMGTLALEARYRPASDLVQEAAITAMDSIAQVTLFSAPASDTIQGNGIHYAGLRAYPALMVLFGSAVIASSVESPESFWPFTQANQTMRRYGLFGGASEYRLLNTFWEQRPALDELFHILDRREQLDWYPTVGRLKALMTRPDWLGAAVSYFDHRRLMTQAEVLVSVGYGVSSTLYNRTPGVLPSEWMRYTDAPAILMDWLLKLTPGRLSELTGQAPERLTLVMEQLDQLAQSTPSLMPVQAVMNWQSVAGQLLTK
ncbi:AlbA family DNA-binding domain-containing protein [Deinococcus sp. PEB2-67]